MDKGTRNNIQRATQAGRTLLERAFSEQLEGVFDILLDGTISEQAGSHLSDRQKVTREKLVAAVAYKRSTGLKAKEAVDTYLREAAFTTLNRFVALKMLEARELVQECISKGDESSGFKEFTALAPGLVALPDKGYRLYIETLFDEIGQEVKVLFDRRDVASLLWPDRQALLELLSILNAPELSSVWTEDETIGWVYQYFNGDEERTKMRAESQAPRNSRELAVRNQFFTPRYVVQFLTDNTLGRTWYEMMQGKTKLAHLDYLVHRPNEVFLAKGASSPESEVDDSKLTQEELIQQTVYVPFRAKKDPRDLRILDPACGSGHFLLYAFELLVSIYKEAWSDTDTAAFTETGTMLQDDFDSHEELQRAMPELILRHNLHGVDIDPRAAQIAALALWMRAQRAYNQFDVDRAERPPITKTNIVVAEPMPGDAELVEEFAASLNPAILGDLFRKMVEEMKLAGELGSLLKIEESIAKAVKQAEESHRQGSMFAGKAESQDFWDTADEKIIAALASFAESAGGSAGIRRRLFAGDAAQGVAFIELMRKRFDVVLMNPPFGYATPSATTYLESHYAGEKNDVYAAFVARGTEILVEQAGRVGAITSSTGLTLGHLETFRKRRLLGETGIELLADLGAGVLDGATVRTAAYVVTRQRGILETMARLQAIDLTRAEDKAQTLASTQSEGWASLPLPAFLELPGAPIAYGMLAPLLSLYRKRRTLEQLGADVNVGMMTGDDFRFIRAHWEVEASAMKTWSDYEKGNGYRKFVADPVVVVSSADGFREVGADVERKYGSAGRFIMNRARFGQPGLVYTRITNKGFSVRVMPPGLVFSGAGLALFANGCMDRMALASYLNSRPVEQLLRCLTDGRKWEAGYVRRTPVPRLQDDDERQLSAMCAQACVARLSILAMDETAHIFAGGMSPYFVEDQRPVAWESYRSALIKIDEIVASLFKLTPADLARIDREVGNFDAWAEREVGEFLQSPEDNWGDYLSWVIGTTFGRFDVNVVSDEPNPPPAAQIDVALRRCSPGMLTGTDGLPLDAPPPGYVIDWLPGGALVDDPGHSADLITRMSQVLAVVWSDRVDEVTDDASHAVNPGAADLRNWLRRSFFGSHIKRYSKSRRKAPIYWQLATPSASYSVWCYYQRLTRDTFFRVANDFVTPKVDHEERKLNALRQEAGLDQSSKQRKAIDAQETFVAELRAFKTEVTRIAPLWNPNLNDGVIVNFAPLWRLVPQHKPWQKECKKIWDKLVKGDYDWAHLAMHLWPERVVPKCQDDRSLAIAHGLEGDFWYEDDDGKWKKRQLSDERIEELSADRSSTAVKAALKDLIDAPTPAAGQTRRKRKAKA